MPSDPSPESVARAAQLRAQIEKLTSPGAKPLADAPEATSKSPPKSPRELIHEQMIKRGEKPI
jgi:hypothetical protein